MDRKLFVPAARLWAALLAAAALFFAVGAAPAFPTEEGPEALPLWLLEESAEPGELRKLSYTCALGGGEARAAVYLPHGYDPAERYDAVILWPGTGSGPEDALEAAYPCRMADGEDHPLSVQALLDRLIEEGAVRPFLLVCPEESSRSKLSAARKDLATVLGLLEENYSVWTAADGLSPAELRRHYVFVGFSQGAIYTDTLAMAEFFDRFSAFAAVGYGSQGKLCAAAINQSPLPADMLYVLTGGAEDQGAAPARRFFQSVTRRCPEKLVPGENAFLRTAESYGHHYGLLTAALGELLPVLLSPEAGSV